MKELKREDIPPIVLNPGDTLSLTVPDRSNPLGRVTVAEIPIERHMVVDVAVIVELEPGELGLAGGIGGFFGRKPAP